ncbi:MAG: DUF1259 domain-containing protein [Acidobacteriota bacterium]|nr:DUF1259 domain-containing protein [Acidobacteriota bacterium]
MFLEGSRQWSVRAAQAYVFLSLVSALVLAQQPLQQAQPARVAPGKWAAVAHALGVAGDVRGDVFRVGFAPFAGRVWMHRVALAPGAVEQSWAAFGQQGALGWMIGRVLLPASEGARIAGVMAHDGLDVTGVVDPLPGSSPAITVIYFRGMGDVTDLARTLKKSLGPALRPARQAVSGELGRLNVTRIEQVLGRRGEPDAGALIFRIPRPEQIKCCGLSNDPLLVFSGLSLGPVTGMESRIAFQPQGVRAVVSGRLAVRHDEVGPVERALEVFGIETVALAESFPDEQPRIFFLHFFGRGKPLELALGMRAALERMQHLPPVTRP